MKAYRYEDIRYAGSDEGDRGELRVELREFDILKETPRGYWIDLGFGGKRYVLNDAKKRFVCRSKEAAVESFRARKNRQRSILQARLADVAMALAMAENLP